MLCDELLDGLLELSDESLCDELLDGLLELSELEVLSELVLIELLVELLAELLELVEELELDALDSSSIERIWSRSSERGPGNCRSPVWKFRMSGALVPPPVKTSISFAW